MLVAKFQPLKTTEDILVFSRGGERVNYFPIYTEGAKDRSRESPQKKKTSLYGSIKSGEFRHGDNKKGSQRYPKHLIEFSNANHRNKYHSTQKPVALFEYLIKTYTNEGDTVLDNVAGSGTTGVACQNLNRDFILIEKEPEYVEIIKQRLRQ